MLNAIYTMCYKDVLEECPTLLDNIQWDTPEHTEKLKEMLYAKYYNKEISGETIGEQKIFMEQKFIQYRDYYTEMLSAYETSIAWLDGLIISHSQTDTTSVTEGDDISDNVKNYHGKTETHSGEDVDTLKKGITETTVTTRDEAVTTEVYDLPRSQSTENRPSGKTVVTPDGQENTTTVTPGEGEDSTTLSHGHVITDGGMDEIVTKRTNDKSKSGTDTIEFTTKKADLINQKERYLALIRSLYSEFADKFSPCFIDLFS